MPERCENCATKDSIRCLECMEGGFCFYVPLVELYPANQKPRKPYVPPAAEVVPITNEMHLRSLGIDALADFLAEYAGDAICRYNIECEDDMNAGRDIPIERCRECALAWLKAPYVPKEDADENRALR